MFFKKTRNILVSSKLKNCYNYSMGCQAWSNNFLVSNISFLDLRAKF